MSSNAFLVKSSFKLDFRPLNYLLSGLSGRGEQNLLRRAIRRGINVGKEKIKANSTGDYRKAVSAKVGTKGDGRVYAVTGVRSAFTVPGTAHYYHEAAPKKPVRYAWWLEVGRHSGRPMTAQHIVRDSIDYHAANEAIMNYLKQEWPKLLGGK